MALAPVSAVQAQAVQSPEPISAQTSAQQNEAKQAVEPAVLPVDVERVIRFRALGLGQDEPFGGSLEVSALFDSNINRATRADAIGTMISGVVPDDYAQPGYTPPAGVVPPPPGAAPGVGDSAISDLGLSVRGQAWLRRQVDNDSDFLLRLSGSGELYGDRRFNDVGLSVQAGPEYFSGIDRIAVFAGPTWRWYAAEPYSLALGGGVSWQHPIGNRVEMRLELEAAHVDNRRDDVLDGAAYVLTAELDRILSRRGGVGAQFQVVRETARDPAYSTTRAELTLHGYHTFGLTTLIATVGYSHLEADHSLDAYPLRRVDDRFTASLTGTFNGLRLGPLAPLVRLNWERNGSRVDFYDFNRVAGEIGVVAAF